MDKTMELSAAEKSYLAHVGMFGHGHNVAKLGAKWEVKPLFGVGSFPVLYKTKEAAVEATVAFYRSLREREAA